MEPVLPDKLYFLILLAAVVALTGCNPYLYSPPTRTAYMEPAEPVGVDEIGTSATFSSFGQLFGMSARSGTVGLRHGFSDEMEVGFDANLVAIDDSRSVVDQSNRIWSARLAGKWAPEVFTDNAALSFGLGGGTSTGGDFFSPDIGAVFSLTNSYVIPFGSLHGFVSQPINAQPVDLSMDDEEPGTNVSTANTTWGFVYAMGIQVPINLSDAKISPRLGMTISRMSDGNRDTGLFGGEFGIAVTLP